MKSLQDIVQHNCHISDAQYAGNYTLCIYLLKMREYFRWEKGYAFGQKLSNDEVGGWLTAREALWDEVEEKDLAPLSIQGQVFNPYHSKTINDAIQDQGLVYSGGYGLHGKPVFFLAQLEDVREFDDYTLYVSGTELSRDLAAPPGMAQDKCIYIRKQSLQRFLWEKIEESQWHSQENPLARALASYDFQQQPDDSLNQMTNTEVETIIHHEIGEIKAGQILGEEWEVMLANLPRSQAELMARAVRDHIADSLSTLPELIRNDHAPQIHFYFANLSSMRKVIFPSLMQAYTEWLESPNYSVLNKLVGRARQHWIHIAQDMLILYRKHGADASPYIESLIKSNYL